MEKKQQVIQLNLIFNYVRSYRTNSVDDQTICWLHDWLAWDITRLRPDLPSRVLCFNLMGGKYVLMRLVQHSPLMFHYLANKRSRRNRKQT